MGRERARGRPGHPDVPGVGVGEEDLPGPTVADGWQVVHLRSGDVHILPIVDLYDHELRRGCWCDPGFSRQPGADCVVVHNAMDGRELIERYGIN